MSTKKSSSFACILLFLLVQNSFAAEDSYFKTEIGTQIVKIWIPGDIQKLRGAIIHLRDTSVRREDFHVFCRSLGFCKIGGMIDHGSEQDASGPANVLKTALKNLAILSNRPEIEFLPLAQIGFSNGGWMAINLAKEMPEQTICVAMTDMPGLSHDTLNSKHVLAFQKTPVSQIINSEFGTTRTWVTQFNPVLRSRDYEYCLSMQWGFGHTYANSNALQFPFIQEACKMRLPDTIDASKGPVKLKDIDISKGLLGDTKTWNSKMPYFEMFSPQKVKSSQYVWIISEKIAFIWRSFTANNPVNKVSSIWQNQVYTFRVSNLSDSVDKVEYFDGNEKMGEAFLADSFKYIHVKELTPGAHGISAILNYKGGTKEVTNPFLLLTPPNTVHVKENFGRFTKYQSGFSKKQSNRKLLLDGRSINILNMKPSLPENKDNHHMRFIVSKNQLGVK